MPGWDSRKRDLGVSLGIRFTWRFFSVAILRRADEILAVVGREVIISFGNFTYLNPR